MQNKTTPGRSCLFVFNKLHSNFGIAPSWEAEVLQAVDSLWCGTDDVDKALVHTHFKHFAALFVDMRALHDREGAAASWQWYRTGDLRAGTKRRVNNLFCRLVDDLVVIGLQANANSRCSRLICHEMTPCLCVP